MREKTFGLFNLALYPRKTLQYHLLVDLSDFSFCNFLQNKMFIFYKGEDNNETFHPG